MKRWGWWVVGVMVAVLIVFGWQQGRARFGRQDANWAYGGREEIPRGAPLLRIPPHSDPRTQERCSLAGTVRNEAGAPISLASVCATLQDDELPTELTREAACVTTDVNGRYSVENLVATKYSVAAGAKGYRPETFQPKGDIKRSSFQLTPGEKKTGVDLTLRSDGVEITGVVSDISGGPIAHAKVWATAGFGAPGDSGGSSPLVETDAQGLFSLFLGAGKVQVFATADGYGPTSEAGRAPGEVSLILTPESSLAGVVVDAASGGPVAGAKVSVTQPASPEGNDGGIDLSDAAGKFRVTRLRPGRYTVTAKMERGYGTAEGSILVGLGQQVEGVVVRVFNSVKIVGRVMLAGKPPRVCVVASVGLTDKVHQRTLRARTEADGTLIAEGVLPGTYKVEPWCEGSLAHETYEPIVVVDKDIVGLTWQVESGATIRGKVFSQDGHTVENAAVIGQTVGGGPRSAMGLAFARSARDGSYELTGLPPGTYQLDVSSDDGAATPAGYTVDVVAGQTVEKNLLLLAGGALKGYIKDTEGAPVEGATIDVNRAASGPPGVPAIESMPNGSDGLRSDRQGAFNRSGLRPGEYQVSARRGLATLKKPGAADNAEPGEKVTVSAGETATVQLVVVSQTRAIQGTVVTAANEPVPDAFVLAAPESDAPGIPNEAVYATRGWGWGSADKPVLAGVDGTFVISKLAPGKYTLRAYRKGGGEVIAEHVEAGSTVKLEIKPTGSITGQATRGGSVIEQLRVQLEDPKTGFTRSEVFFRTEGRFTFRDLPAGHFYLTAAANGSQRKIELNLGQAETKTGVTLPLEDLIAITGRIVDQFSKAPVAGMRAAAGYPDGGNLALQWEPDDEQLANISDEQGRFTIHDAPRGKLQIRCSPREPSIDYTEIAYVHVIEGAGTVDIGDLTIIKNRVKPGEAVGDLGFRAPGVDPATQPENFRLEVTFIEPKGPAAGTDLKVGDIVNTIDGVDVTGSNGPRMWPLLAAPPGTKITFGLARGATIAIVLGPPR